MRAWTADCKKSGRYARRNIYAEIEACIGTEVRPSPERNVRAGMMTEKAPLLQRKPPSTKRRSAPIMSAGTDCNQVLAQTTKPFQLSSMSKESRLQSVGSTPGPASVSLRTHVAEIARWHRWKARSACGDGAARRAHGRRRPGSARDGGQSKARLTYDTTCDTNCTGGRL